ncbi:MAG: ribose-phosphate pyrophosphokinase [Deltaproteobacteria bacterium]|jgi:ribose-phosphate pyrophosphokinase|nr:ribose-phosphate pyrophosphokinase [Deltaproteobacteria bacterium]MBK9644118.1 ribose-phosphate pyrophosphokinase [Deltaproteobacteria bacterium]MCK6517961.1 ribose-phosphate pyrophosphokinase [Myxococcota bacterium]
MASLGYGEIKLFSGNANPELATAIAAHLGLKLGDAKVSRFSDGEVQVEIGDNVRGRDVYIIQPTCAPANDHLMELLIMGDACKRASAGRLTAVIPYYGYSRQDRKVAPRAPITAKLVADLLTAAGFHRVLTIDLHAGQIQGFFDIPVDNLYGSTKLVSYLREKVGRRDDIVVVSPDAGGVERARAYAKHLRAGLAIVDKRRSGPNVAEIMHIIGDVRGRYAVLVDDMIDTAGTLAKAASAIVEAGATGVMAVATHAILSGNAAQRIAESALDEVVVSNTVPLSESARATGRITVVTIADVLAESIRSIHHADSVSRLFRI